MGAFFGAIVSWVLGLFFKGSRQPSAEAIATGNAAAAQTALANERLADGQLAKARLAVEAVERVAASDGDQLRHDIAADPDNLAS